MKQATAVAGRVKQIASFLALAFSPVQGLYQTIQGLWQDISLIIRKPDGTQAFTLKNMYDAADGADVFALITEWRQFRMPSWNVIKKVMVGNVVVDGRNIYDRQELEEQGFVYTRIGEK